MSTFGGRKMVACPFCDNIYDSNDEHICQNQYEAATYVTPSLSTKPVGTDGIFVRFDEEIEKLRDRAEVAEARLSLTEKGAAVILRRAEKLQSLLEITLSGIPLCDGGNCPICGEHVLSPFGGEMPHAPNCILVTARTALDELKRETSK